MIRITAEERAYWRRYAMETGVGDLTEEQRREIDRIAQKLVDQTKERIARGLEKLATPEPSAKKKKKKIKL